MFALRSRLLRGSACAITALLLAAPPAIAQSNYPNRPIKLVVSYPPGALTDLLSGNIQVMFSDTTIAVPNIQAGKVIALGTSAAKQTQLLPAVPPIADSVPGFDWQAWQGVVAPAGTPKDIVALLAAELRKIQATPEFREQLFKFGMDPLPPQTPEQFAAIIQAEQPRWAKAIEDSGAKVD